MSAIKRSRRIEIESATFSIVFKGDGGFKRFVHPTYASQNTLLVSPTEAAPGAFELFVSGGIYPVGDCFFDVDKNSRKRR